MEPTDVTALVRRAAEGDAAAWEALVAEYGGMVEAVARGFRLSEAQVADATQTTWLRLVEHLAEIREPACLAGWLRTTVRRVCLATVRDARREALAAPTAGDVREVGDRADDGDEAGPEASVLRRDQQLLLRRAVAVLPHRDRRLMVLLAASPPLSYKEISAGLGMPVGSIGPRRARVFSRLRAELATVGLHDLAPE